MRRTLLLITIGIASCESPPQQAAGPLVRDSAGVRIVEYSAVAGGAPLIDLSASPLYGHGAGLDDYQFADITAGALLADGSVVVADRGNNEVVAIAAGGSSHSVLARSGEGPGEVLRVRGLFTLGGDSLLVEDDGNSRFSLFVGDSLVRSTSSHGLMERSSDFNAHGLDDSGALLMSTSSWRPGFEVAWLPGFMVRVDLDRGTMDTVAVHDYARRPDDDLPNPFSPFGRVTASAGEFVSSRSDVPEVVWRRSDGSIRQIVRWRPEREFPTDDHLDQYKASWAVQLKELNPQISESDIARIADSQEMVLVGDEPLPLFMRIQGDDAGRLWMSEYVVDYPTGQPTVYTVIASDGSWLGTIRLPWKFRLLAVRGERALGVVWDEFDVESVVVHELLLDAGLEDGISAR